MPDLSLKKMLMGVVDNQLRDRNPQSTVDTFEKLQEMGYSKAEAKAIIAVAVAEEIYSILKEKKPFDENRYMNQLDQVIGAMPKRETDNWKSVMSLIEKGQEHLEKQDDLAVVNYWMDAWKRMKSLLKPLGRVEVEQLEAEIHYAYDMRNWFGDVLTQLLSGKEYGTCNSFCWEVLEYLKMDEYLESEIKRTLANTYFFLGSPEKSDELFKMWLKEDPDNIELIGGWIRNLQARGEMDKALSIVEQMIEKDGGQDINLLMTAADICKEGGNEEKAQYYEDRIQEEQERDGQAVEQEHEEMLWDRGLIARPPKKGKRI